MRASLRWSCCRWKRKVYTGAAVDRFDDASAQLFLKDGTAVPASLVLVSAGIRANLELAKNAGLACGRGIVVDAALRTSAPNVFAAGDCAVSLECNPEIPVAPGEEH